jgi:hypothetical protein
MHSRQQTDTLPISDRAIINRNPPPPPPAQSESAYQRALTVNDESPPAWQGLAELYTETRQWAKAPEAYQALVGFPSVWLV